MNLPNYKLYTLDTTKYVEDFQTLKRLYPLIGKARQERVKQADGPEERCEIICGGYLIVHALSDFFGITDSSVMVTPDGKPYDAAHPTAYFNLSHSHGKLVLVASVAPCGIDLEWVDPTTKYETIVKRFFTERERNLIYSRTDFYDFWTVKESYAKMTGKGMAVTLKNTECFQDGGQWKIADASADTSRVLFQKVSRFDGYCCNICFG